MATSSILLQSLIHILPTLLLCVIGGIIALTRLRDHRRPAMFVLVALSILAITVIGSIVLQQAIVRMGSNGNTIGAWFMIIGIMRTLSDILVYGLLIAAAFIGRGPNAPDPHVDLGTGEGL